MDKIHKIFINKAKCAVDLGDGSERGEYVNQDYILSRLGRPMRGISLMYCYYPLDRQWPARISEVEKDAVVTSPWEYSYDDYFPYLGGIGGNTSGEPFASMRDVRRHGQDVILTLTIDPHVSDEHLAAIGEDLRPFGRVFLRINHEATGGWFNYNKRGTFQDIADFYCRAAKIIKEHAPNVLNIICIGGIVKPESVEMERENEFLHTLEAADIWSVDNYMALHWGWPYDIAETGGKSHKRSSVREIYDMTKASFERFKFLSGGKDKPMLMSELNADGDVTGPYEQAEMIELFCNMIEDDNADWFSGFTLYQFRDRGRLGLELEDPNNSSVGIEQPLMGTFKKIISRERFKPVITVGEEISLPATLRWSNSEDAEGIAVPLEFDGNPIFCELWFNDDSNLMLEINDRWFYKAPQTKYLDLMPAFYENPLNAPCTLPIRIFAPPASGENDLTLPDGLFNSYSTIEKLPEIRIRTSPIIPSLDRKDENT